MEHKESLGMRLCPQPVFTCDISLCLCTICECDKWAEMIRMFILSFWASSWTLKLFLKYIVFSIDILTTYTAYLVLFHHIHYILNTHIKQKYHCTSPLAYKHCKLKWEKIVNTNTSPTHFQCTGYLYIQMLIQIPASDSPIIVFNYTLH